MAPNLIPFTGLDDCWPLADTLRIPDLAHRSRGTLTQLITSLAGKNPVTAGDWMLAGYRASMAWPPPPCSPPPRSSGTRSSATSPPA